MRESHQNYGRSVIDRRRTPGNKVVKIAFGQSSGYAKRENHQNYVRCLGQAKPEVNPPGRSIGEN